MGRVSGETRHRRPRERAATAIAAILLGAAVALALGIYARAHAPTGRAPISFGFGLPGEMKVWFTRAAAVLALFQLTSGLRIYGRMPFPRRLPRWLPIAHRASGGLAVLLAIPVGFDCVAAFGFRAGSGRLLLHGAAGLVLFGAFAAKVVAIQRRRRPTWLVPLIGVTLFVALSLLWLTSLGWPVSIY